MRASATSMLDALVIFVVAVSLAGCAARHLVPTLAPRVVKVQRQWPNEKFLAGEVHDVVLVGNNWDGTATILIPHTLSDHSLDLVPDLEERMAAINKDRDRAAIVRLNRRVAGEGHDQLVDDLFTSPDGRMLYVSRPSLGDVAAFDLETRERKWRTDVEGFRADHAALSRDGKTLLVSATRARKVHAIDTGTGAIIGGFASGTSRMRMPFRVMRAGFIMTAWRRLPADPIEAVPRSEGRPVGLEVVVKPKASTANACPARTVIALHPRVSAHPPRRPRRSVSIWV